MSDHNSARLLAIILLALLATRVATLGIPALVDTTEGRYSSIAQTMYLSGDWVTPKVPLFERGSQPYWGKPPLYFWLTATSFSVFGMNEWAARLPCFLCALLTIFLVTLYARRFFDGATALTSSLILASSGLFFFFSAGCITDTTLSATIAGAIVSFAFCIETSSDSAKGRQRLWGILMFVFLALGMLTKGPVAIVLPGGIIFFWCVLTGGFKSLIKLPWIYGTIAFVAIAAPWFVLSEHRTPGFLQYFFIQENLGRYLTHKYKDLYGSGHVYPYFSSWWMAAAAFAPWTFCAIPLLLARKSLEQFWVKQNPNVVLCLTWALFPPLFFTFARQLTASYILPAMPGLALLIGWLILRSDWMNSGAFRKYLGWACALILIGCCAAAVASFRYQPELANRAAACALALASVLGFFWIKRTNPSTTSLINYCATLTISMFLIGVLMASSIAENMKSTRKVLEYVRSLEPAQMDPALFPTIGVLYGRPYSAYFYSASDQAHQIKIVSLDLESALTSNAQRIMIRDKDFYQVPANLSEMFPQETQIGKWLVLKRKSA